MKPGLDQPLPAAVAVGSNRWLTSYHNYPVFSRPWLIRRSLLFGTAIALWGAISGLAHMGQGHGMISAIQLFGYFFTGVLTMVSAGPLLAGLVRHWVARQSLQRPLVVIAIIVGLGLAFAADHWSSDHIMRLAEQPAMEAQSKPVTALNIGVLLAVYFFLGGGLALRAYLSEHRRLAEFEQHRAMAELEQQKLESDRQLSLLQAQIEPHFLFNTLGTIRSVLRQDPARAEATLDALCAYLRSAMPRMRHGAVDDPPTLARQAELCRRYLEIMQLRMGDRLDFEIMIDTEAARQPFPPFMLLTLVENAIKHGLEPQARGGKVVVTGRIENQVLMVEVGDNGRGLSDPPGQGCGLANLRAQLRARYDDRASLTLRGGEHGGVCARLQIPVDAEDSAT